MAKTDYTVSKFQITTSSATAAFHDIGPYITEFSGIEVVGETEETHGMGDSFAENSFTGLKRTSPITISGFYDDVAASGPHAILGQTTDIGAERCIKLNLGTTDAYPKTDVIIKRYTRHPVRGELTKFECELLPTASYSIVTT